MDGLAKQYGTCSMLCQSLCVISKPSMHSNWSYSPKTLNSGQNRHFFCVNLKFDGWAWKTIALIFKLSISFIAIGQFKLEFLFGNVQFGPKSVPCDLEIWRKTSKNNRVPLPCQCKLCASFRSDVWIQTGVTVRKRPNWDKICLDLYDLCLWTLTLTICMDTTLVDGNNSWKFLDTMRGTW